MTSKTFHTEHEANAMQVALHKYKVPYTLEYVYKDEQRDSMEYWKFSIPDASKLFNAVINSVYESYLPPK